MLMKIGFVIGTGSMFNKNNKKYDEFFEIFKNLKEPLQLYLLESAKILLDSQNKL